MPKRVRPSATDELRLESPESSKPARAKPVSPECPKPARVRPRSKPVSPESPKPARPRPTKGSRLLPSAKTPPPISSPMPELSPSLTATDKSTVMPQSSQPISRPKLRQSKPIGGIRDRRASSSWACRPKRRPRSVPTLQSTVNSDSRPVSKVLNKYRGVWHDLFSITNAYELTGSKSFKDFLMLCQEKKVMEIFRGIPNLGFLLELTETVMLRCKEMWLEINPLEKQVSWFYLLCVMYLYQPKALLSLNNGVRIRLVETDHSAICKFVLQTRSRKIEDVDLMLQVLHGKLAFVSSLTSLTYGLEKIFMQCFVEDTEKAEFMEKSVVFPRLAYSLQESFTKLNDELRDYCSAKESLFGLSIEFDRGRRNDLVEGLSALKPNFVDELVSCLPADMKTDICSTSVET